MMMKRFTRILGLALPVVMVLALAVVLLPASTPQAQVPAGGGGGGGPGELCFSKIPLPKFGAAGGYVLTPDVDVGPIAVTPGGTVLYASANISVPTPASDLLKSTDDGYTWTLKPGFRTAADANADTSSIVDIVASPRYSSDNTVFVATQDYVYQSVDGGLTFATMSTFWATEEANTDMDVTLDGGGQLSIIIGTKQTAASGDVYVYCPATTGMSWQAQSVPYGDVLAAAFSPNFAADEGIMAVTCDDTATTIKTSLGNTSTGGGWGVDVGDGVFKDRTAMDIVATRARIAFPDDFDVDSITSNVCFVGLYAGPPGTANEKGDVYKVVLQPGATSTTLDLNVRGLIESVPTATNIWSIDVSGNATAANIMVGTDFWSLGVANYYWTSYYSTDSGQTWSSDDTKPPTGGDPTWSPALPDPSATLVEGEAARCYVALSPDFATSGVAYASTSGSTTSAFSRTANMGRSWNQISFIDYGNAIDFYKVTRMWADIVYASTQTFYMVTAVTLDPYDLSWAWTGGAVWKTTNGGANYERIWSYANPTVTQMITSVTIYPDNMSISESTTVFATDLFNGTLWRSSDGGASFPRIITAKEGWISNYSVLAPDTIWTTHWNNNIWYTSNSGVTWVAPATSNVTGAPLQIAGRGNIVLVPNATGQVFISTDNGTNFTQTLGTANLTGAVLVIFDWNYETNHYVYAAVMQVDGGVWRIAVNEADPGSTAWQRIDATSPGATTVNSLLPLMLVGDVIYVTDTANVTTGNVTGGIWRCANPSAASPSFVKWNCGLNTDDMMTFVGWSLIPNTVFLRNTSPDCLYYNQLVVLADTTVPYPGATEVRINAPGEVAPGTDFAATVDISQVANFDACNYDVSFDPTVLRLDNVTSGSIHGTVIPVKSWTENITGTFRIVQNVPGIPGVTGSGYLAVLHFHVLGSEGQSSNITLSNGVLGDNQASQIPATWIGSSVRIPTITPTVATSGATNITSNSATLNGNLDSLGTATTLNVSFQWRTGSGSYTSETIPVSTNATGEFSFTLGGLNPSATYYFRAKVDGGIHGTNFGAERTFTTLTPPSVTTNNTDNITFTSARLNGNLDSLGTAATVNVSFQWGTGSGSYTSLTTPVSMNTTGAFSFNLGGLNPNTTYCFRTKADGNIHGTSYGTEKTFTTLLPGDSNGDSKVNALDITGVERIIAGLDAPTPGADANQDCDINALDITKVERIIAGLD